MMMMTLSENPVNQRFLDWCCFSVATGVALASSVTGAMRRGHTEYGPAKFNRPIQHTEYVPSKFSSCRIPNQSSKFKPLRVQSHQLNKQSISNFSSTNSSLDICAAAFNPYAQLETEPKATTTVAPFKEKSKLASVDDGGNKIPPRGGDRKYYDGGNWVPPRGGDDHWYWSFLIECFRLSLSRPEDSEKTYLLIPVVEEEEEWKKVD